MLSLLCGGVWADADAHILDCIIFLPSPSNESAHVSAHEQDALFENLFFMYLPLQCISPGIVETEFAFRHHNSDPEKAAAVYESMKVSERRRLRVNKCISQSQNA